MRLALSALLLASAIASPVAAHATTMDDFVTTGPGLVLTFSLPSSPTPTGSDAKSDFYLGNISFVENGTARTASDVYVYTGKNSGGFDLEDSHGRVIDGLSFLGPQLFTGSVTNPTFKTGDFTLTPFFCTASEAEGASAQSSCRYALTITPESTVTPEPGSLLLLGTGSLGLLGTLRRRLTR